MKCSRCQHDNPQGARFCEECATPLARTCSNCGTALSATAKFCHACAHPVAAVAGAPSRTPDSYTPKHLVERILTSKAALEGERKQVTVLFADLKGSMELLADRDPEEARKILDPVLERMMEAVHRYEGTVNQVMGDGIMALFGAPVAHEDHAVRACYAALRMQEAVAQYAEDVFRSHGVALHIRVGLNSGEVVVRAIGSDLRMDYTAVGQTTHLAARMEQMATPGTILLAPTTLQLAEGYVQVAARGSVAVKGLPDPVELYVLTGASAQRTRLHAATARGLTRFVGRDTEIEQIRRALTLAGDGHGQLVAIVGEPGVGKSRLVYEFTHSHRAQDWLILEASSVSYGKATSYLPVIDLLKTYFKLHDRETHREIREKVTGKLLTLDRTLEPILPAVLALLDVPVEDARWQALDPPQRRQRTLDAVKRLLLRESQGQPLLVVFEDLHWIDAETQALLDGLVESLPAAGILLLVNYRPEYQHGWGNKSYYGQLRIDPLPPESADELLRALVGEDVALQPLKRLLIERTEGNPLFLEESIRTLIETQVLTGERGAYRLAKDVTSIRVAPTVQAVLAARIDRLSPENKRLLQSAAVIGKDVPLALLQAIADGSEDDVRRGLSALEAAEFLYAATLFPDLEYTFKHALTHEVAYGSLLQKTRLALHARIVEAIESFYADRMNEQVERLAYHAFRAEMWEKAVSYLRQAGTKAFGRSANSESAASFEQALAALGHRPETRETLEHAIDLRFDLRNSLLPLGRFETFHGYLREAEVLAKKLDDQRRLGWTWAYLCHYFWMTGCSREARTFGQSAYAIAERLGDFRLTVVASFYLGLACFAAGDYGQAEEFLRKTVPSLEGDLSRERCGLAGFPSVMARSYLGLAVAHRGDVEEGIALAQEGVHLAESLDHPYSLIVACWSLGSLYGVKGELGQAAHALERGLALCREWKLTVLSPLVTGPLGYVYALSGRVAEGLTLLYQALEGMESMGRGAYHSLVLVQLGEASVLAGGLEGAGAFAERALQLTRELGERGYEALALRLLGDLATHDQPPDVAGAEGHYRAAMALANSLGMRPLVAHCHLGLGTLYHRTDKRKEAQEHLATATTMYREMGMTYWLEQAEAETRDLG
jgi:class 3 adenylate cyclase/tetratricopeptide (TPR) repeat protein